MKLSKENLPPGIPQEALPHLCAVGYFHESPTRVGETVPPLQLFTPEGETVPLASLYGERPAVLVFGSFT